MKSFVFITGNKEKISIMERLLKPQGFVKSFTVYHPGQLQKQKSGDANLLGKSAPFNEITVFDGCDKVMAEYTYAEMLDYFKDRHDNYHDFADWLSENR